MNVLVWLAPAFNTQNRTKSGQITFRVNSFHYEYVNMKNLGFMLSKSRKTINYRSFILAYLFTWHKHSVRVFSPHLFIPITGSHSDNGRETNTPTWLVDLFLSTRWWGFVLLYLLVYARKFLLNVSIECTMCKKNTIKCEGSFGCLTIDTSSLGTTETNH